MKRIASILILASLAAGCTTVDPKAAKGAANLALAAGKIAAPEYAGAIAQIQKLLAGDPQKPMDGFTFTRTFYFRGAIVDAKEISWMDQWTKVGTADKSEVPAAITKTASASAADEQLRQDIAEILKASGVAE